MLTFGYILNGLIMIGLPFLLGFFIARRYRQPWLFFVMGAVTFILAQIVHIPLNAALTLAFQNGLLPSPPAQYQLIFNAIVLGLTAGLTEEIARYLMLKFGLKRARGWRAALMFGAGHGGVEAVIFGVLSLVTIIGLFMVQQNPSLLTPLPAEQQTAVQAQIEAIWTAPFYMTLLGALERAFALCLQIALAVIVMQAIVRRQIRWLVFAIAWHTLVDAVAVYAVSTWGALPTEAIVGVFALISLLIIRALRTADEEETTGGAPPSGQPAPAQPLPPTEPTPESLDQSRYAPIAVS